MGVLVGIYLPSIVSLSFLARASGEITFRPLGLMTSLRIPTALRSGCKASKLYTTGCTCQRLTYRLAHGLIEIVQLNPSLMLSRSKRILIVVKRALTASNPTLADAMPEVSFARSRAPMATFNEEKALCSTYTMGKDPNPNTRRSLRVSRRALCKQSHSMKQIAFWW